MAPSIELIYFDGCPNAVAARENLRRAIAALGIESDWQEWEQSDPAAPDYVKQHGSPTILVDGRDVTGAVVGVGGAACRADGAPPTDTIRTALEEVL